MFAILPHLASALVLLSALVPVEALGQSVAPADVFVRSSHAMAYDSARQRMVMFGGSGKLGYFLRDTWERDPSGIWRLVSNSGPSGRYGHAMAYDSARGVVVLFGGYDGTHRGDTWEWDGTTWTQVSATGPAPRAWHSMAYDAASQRVVLFGGYDFTHRMDDTWEWDGTTWTQVAVGTTHPAARANNVAAFDSISSQVLMFGGISQSSGFLGDTWMENFGTWTQRLVSGPGARFASALASDTDRGRIVLFGGDSGTGVLGDTWEWNGNTWNRIDAPGPSPRRGQAMAYDSTRRRVLLTGGWDQTHLGGIWEWDGATWTEVPPVIGTPTPTPTPSLTPSPTPSPSATPSPTPSPTPPPAGFFYDFRKSPEGWSFHHADSAFDRPSAAVVRGDPGYLLLRANNSTNTFGYWESPVISTSRLFPNSDDLGSSNTAQRRESLLVARFRVRSTTEDPARVPQMRLRVTATNLQESWCLVVDSHNDGSYSPTPEGRTYVLPVAVPPSVNGVRIAFEILNVNPDDDPNGDLWLDWAEVAAGDSSALIPQSPIAATDLAAPGFSDWNRWAPVSIQAFATPLFSRGERLGIQGNGRPGTFGFWTSFDVDNPLPQPPLTLHEHDLIVATFEVESDVPAGARSRVPSFRCRLNESTFHLASFAVVESVGKAELSPTRGEPMLFRAYLPVPAEIDGSQLILSFDLADFDPHDNANASIELKNVRVDVLRDPF